MKIVNMAVPFAACFCHCCSFKIVDPAYRYCPKCGTEVFRAASPAESSNTTEPPDSLKTRKFSLPSFKSYKAKKGSERSSFFRAKSTNKTKKSKLEPEKEVTISVGIMTSKETVKRGENLPLKILPSATDKDILIASIAKHSAFNKRFDGKAEYRLVYKDGSEVKSVPGTSPPEPFTLNRYKEESGFGYARIIFYLLPTRDIFEELNDILTESPTSSITEIDSDPEGENLKPVEFLQQDKNAEVTHRESSHYVDCPVCWAKFPIEVIGDHVDICAEAKEEFPDPFSTAQDSPNEKGISLFNFVSRKFMVNQGFLMS